MNACTTATNMFSWSGTLFTVSFEPPGTPGRLPDRGIPLAGNVQTFRGNPAGEPETIRMEIVSLVLRAPSGLQLRAGDGLSNLASDGPLYSPGILYEQNQPEFEDEERATNNFEVSFRLTGGPLGSRVLYTRTPIFLTAFAIDRFPPIDCVDGIGWCGYFFDGDTELFDRNTGLPAGAIGAAVFESGAPIPEPATTIFVMTGLGGFLYVRRARNL
jgi:hypothetical protein